MEYLPITLQFKLVWQAEADGRLENAIIIDTEMRYEP